MQLLAKEKLIMHALTVTKGNPFLAKAICKKLVRSYTNWYKAMFNMEKSNILIQFICDGSIEHNGAICFDCKYLPRPDPK